jgi:DNA-binding CsgD family transcriptional regulator
MRDLSPFAMGHVKLDRLHEREKAVLRLLLHGFDVKASANELQISPNVVNERLRDVRRKLGVTSSREAARILAASETDSHNFFVDRKIGIAADLQTSPQPSQPIHRAVEGEVIGQARVQEQQAAFFAASPKDFQSAAWPSSLPLRQRGERRNDLGKRERAAAIIDLSSKLAAAFALVCLISILLSSLATRL